MRQLEGEHVSTAEARNRLADLINRAAFGQERIVLTRHGKPVAALVPIEDMEWLEDMENQADLAAVREAKEELARDGGKTIPLDEVLKEFGVER
jgi:prevent-host-death family protein